jgi:hypothetical protein
MDRDREQFARERLERRLSRYENRHNPVRVADLLAVKRAEMVRTYGEYARTATQVSRALCDGSGVPTIQYPFYLCFGREMWSKCRKEMSGESSAQEAAVLIAKWVGRDLTQSVLQAIRSEVFNVPAPIAP